MIEPRHRFALGLEAEAEGVVGPVFARQHLDGDGSVERGLHASENGRHAAMREKFDLAVTGQEVAQFLGGWEIEFRVGVGHGGNLASRVVEFTPKLGNFCYGTVPTPGGGFASGGWKWL
jgi:hypothetical protein